MVPVIELLAIVATPLPLPTESPEGACESERDRDNSRLLLPLALAFPLAASEPCCFCTNDDSLYVGVVYDRCPASSVSPCCCPRWTSVCAVGNFERGRFMRGGLGSRTIIVSSELLKVIGADGETDRCKIILEGVAKSVLHVSHVRVKDDKLGEVVSAFAAIGEEVAASTSENSNTERVFKVPRRSLRRSLFWDSDVGLEETGDDNCICDDTRERGGAGRPIMCLEVFELNLEEDGDGQRGNGCRYPRVPGVPPDDPLLLRGMAACTF